jgi:hypothetical protein
MPRSVHRAPVAVVLAAALVLTPAAARAGGSEAAAEALFLEAQKLVKQKKFAEACPKFEESNKLDRGAGTLIHLANCYEKNKQAASAWATYKEAASAAQALGRADWQKLATQRANALEPKLARLTIQVSEPVDKLEVTKDGVPLSKPSWGVALPVDIGAHTITASAPGHEPFTTTANIAKDGEKMEIAVPKLSLPFRPRRRPSPAARRGWRRRLPSRRPIARPTTRTAAANGRLRGGRRRGRGARRAAPSPG